MSRRLERAARNALRERKVRVIVGAGEATVRVKGDGLGGRCSHLCALLSLRLGDIRGWTFAAIATDGIQLPTE